MTEESPERPNSINPRTFNLYDTDNAMIRQTANIEGLTETQSLRIGIAYHYYLIRLQEAGARFQVTLPDGKVINSPLFRTMATEIEDFLGGGSKP